MKGFWKFCKGLFKDDCRDLYTIDCQALGFMVSGLRFRDTDAVRFFACISLTFGVSELALLFILHSQSQWMTNNFQAQMSVPFGKL